MYNMPPIHCSRLIYLFFCCFFICQHFCYVGHLCGLVLCMQVWGSCSSCWKGSLWPIQSSIFTGLCKTGNACGGWGFHWPTSVREQLVGPSFSHTLDDRQACMHRHNHHMHRDTNAKERFHSFLLKSHINPHVEHIFFYNLGLKQTLASKQVQNVHESKKRIKSTPQTSHK